MTTTPCSTATKKRSAAWPAWGEKLAAALAELKEDQYLIVSTKQGHRFVQFAAQGVYGLRSETVSNAYLEAEERLDEYQVRALLSAGWHAPTGTPEESTPDKDPDGSSNFYRNYAAPVPFDAVAGLTVLTFSDILLVPHPGCLQYSAFEAVGEGSRPLELLGLDLKQAEPDDREAPSLVDKVLETIRETTGMEHLEYDSEGDIVLRYGSVLVVVKPAEEASIVRIYCSLVEGVRKRAKLLDRLNELNARARLRFVYQKGGVYALAEVSATPFVGDHLAKVFKHCCETADGMAPLLQAEFGGKRAFPEEVPSSLLH